MLQTKITQNLIEFLELRNCPQSTSKYPSLIFITQIRVGEIGRMVGPLYYSSLTNPSWKHALFEQIRQCRYHGNAILQTYATTKLIYTSHPTLTQISPPQGCRVRMTKNLVFTFSDVPEIPTVVKETIHVRMRYF